MATRSNFKSNKKPDSITENSQIKNEHGKLPPQALELEEAILGAIMLEKDAAIVAIDILKAESFYKDSHQKIFRVVIELSTSERPIDMLTVTEELRRKKELEEVGGPYYIAQLTGRVSSAVNLEFHSRIVQQKFIQRELIRITTNIQTRAFDDSVDVNDLLDDSEAALFEIASGNIKKDSVIIGQLVQMAIKQMEEMGKRTEDFTGIPSGFTNLDRMTSGWQPSDLIIIAARPAMGKTAFVLSMTRNMAVIHKKAVAVFSLEMASIQLVNRLIAAESELGSEKIRSGRLSPEEWQILENKIANLETAPIFIDDTPGISIFELRAKCRRLAKQHKIECVIIDYLQLMTGPPETKGNREQEVSIISRSLKGLAKELNVPILALSQLNRSVESRTGNKRPQLSDLRESGAIEQDADLVCFIHRPEKYGILEDEEGNSMIGKAEIIIAKHRNGAVGDVRLRFRDTLAKFEDDSDLPDFNDVDIKPIVTTVGSKMNNDTTPIETTTPFAMHPNTGFDKEAPF